MAVQTDSDKWRKHYLSMIEGKIPLNQDVYVVSGETTSQVGKGLQIISPAEANDARARAAVVKKTIRKSVKRKRTQSASRRSRVKTAGKKKSTKRRKR